MRYLRETGRPEARIREAEAYFRAQNCFGSPRPGDIDYSQVQELDLRQVVPCVAGPKRPQDSAPLPDLKDGFRRLLATPVTEGGYGKAAATDASRPRDLVRDGDVVVAAITSCKPRGIMPSVTASICSMSRDSGADMLHKATCNSE